MKKIIWVVSTLCFVECRTFNFKRALQALQAAEDPAATPTKTKIPRWKPSSTQDETVTPVPTTTSTDEEETSNSSSLAIIVFVIGSMSALVLVLLYKGWLHVPRPFRKKIKKNAFIKPKLGMNSFVASEMFLESTRKTDYNKFFSNSEFIPMTSRFSGASSASEMIFLDSFRKTGSELIPMTSRFNGASMVSEMIFLDSFRNTNREASSAKSDASEMIFLDSFRNTNREASSASSKSDASEMIFLDSIVETYNGVSLKSDGSEMIFLDSIGETYSNYLSNHSDCIPTRRRFSGASLASSPRSDSRPDLNSTIYSIVRHI